jgi:hypothetical protein
MAGYCDNDDGSSASLIRSSKQFRRCGASPSETIQLELWPTTLNHSCYSMRSNTAKSEFLTFAPDFSIHIYTSSLKKKHKSAEKYAIAKALKSYKIPLL